MLLCIVYTLLSILIGAISALSISALELGRVSLGERLIVFVVFTLFWPLIVLWAAVKNV